MHPDARRLIDDLIAYLERVRETETRDGMAGSSESLAGARGYAGGRLTTLHQLGLITGEEFAAAGDRVIAVLGDSPDDYLPMPGGTGG